MMWNECDIWLRHHERVAQLRHEASVVRLCRQRRLAWRKGGILATLQRRGWLRPRGMFHRQMR
jgi:hypothetical protein